MKSEYTFDDFEVTDSNRFAHAACLAVSQNPGEIYNPLLLYGPTQSGKTHLLRAIQSKLSELFPDKKILRISMMDFTEQFIEGIKDEGKGLPNRNLQYDVLLIDDLFYLAGRQNTQEALAHLVMLFAEKNKQVVLASEGSIKDIARFSQLFRDNPKMPKSLFCEIFRDETVTAKKTNTVPLDRFILYYLRTQRHPEGSAAYSPNSYKELCAFRELVFAGKIPFSFTEADRYIDLLNELGEADGQKVKQYLLIRELLVSKDAEYLLPDVFGVLCHLCEREVISFPIIQTLTNNFGVFVCELCVNLSGRDMEFAFREEITISRKIMLLACGATPKDDVDVWENKMDYLSDTAFDGCDFSEATEGEDSDGFYRLSRMIVKTDHNIYENLKDAKALPYYYTDDADKSDTCIGNMITLVDADDGGRSVTFQIYAHKHYETFSKMFESEDFGFKNKKALYLATKCKEFFKNMTTEDRALALFVKNITAEGL